MRSRVLPLTGTHGLDVRRVDASGPSSLRGNHDIEVTDRPSVRRQIGWAERLASNTFNIFDLTAPSCLWQAGSLVSASFYHRDADCGTTRMHWRPTGHWRRLSLSTVAGTRAHPHTPAHLIRTTANPSVTNAQPRARSDRLFVITANNVLQFA